MNRLRPFVLVVAAAGLFVSEIRADEPPEFILMWGSTGSGDTQFSSPWAIACSADDQVYVLDTWNYRVQKFDTEGNFILKWGTQGSGDGEFDRPYGVACDPSGNVYVGEKPNGRVQKFDPDGNFLLKWGSTGTGGAQLSNVGSLACDAAGDVYLVDSWPNGNRIVKFDGNGNFLLEWGSWGSGDGQFRGASGVACDPFGHVYVGSFYDDRIQKFDDVGNFLLAWGSSGSGDGQFGQLHGMSCDPSGDLYVADGDYNQRIQKFDGSGNFILTWGSYGGGEGEFSGPSDVALDASGNFYVADDGNRRIQKFGRLRVAVSGAVTSDCAGPLLGVTVDLLHPSGDYYSTTATDDSGSYVFADVPYGTSPAELSVSVPLGFQDDVPVGAEETIIPDQDRTVDFSLLCSSPTGAARGKGYWKHQASVYVKGKGSAQESETDMRTTYPDALFDHFHENQLSSIAVEGVTFLDSSGVDIPLDLDTVLETLMQKGSQLDKAKQQYLAVLLNLASEKVLSSVIVSDDGATASQAIQHVAALIKDGDPANDELAKDISESINEGDLVGSGVIPLTLPTIFYSRPQVADAPLVFSPNPGGAMGYTVSFAMPVTGPAELVIYDVAGRKVATLVSGTVAAGREKVTWQGRGADGARLGHGVYFARLTTPKGTKTAKVVHLSR